jgi:predicted GIY-YIG superfamily endonuclease
MFMRTKYYVSCNRELSCSIRRYQHKSVYANIVLSLVALQREGNVDLVIREFCSFLEHACNEELIVKALQRPTVVEMVITM